MNVGGVITNPVEDTGDEMGDDRRSLTQNEIEQMVETHRRAAISARREEILHGMELKLAEIIGSNGDGGEFRNLQEKVDKMEEKLDKIELWSHKMKWTIGLAATVGTTIATITFAFIQHWFFK